jgi:ABC-type multidrug transport system fused ATPase/permease subunit
MSTDTTTESRFEASAPKLTFREHVQWLWRYWRPHRSILVALALFTLVSTVVAVAYPLVFRWVLDRVAGIFDATAPAANVRGVMLVLTAILVGNFIARLYPAARAMMNARLERDIRDGVFGEIMAKDYHFSHRFLTGDVVTRLTDDISEFPKVSWFGCSGIFRAVESASRIIFCLVAMVVMNPKLTALSVIPLPIMMWIFYSLRHKMHYYMEASQQSVSKTNNLLESVFTGIRIVKSFSAEAAQSRRLADILRERVRVLLGLVRLQMVMFSLDNFAARFGQMIVISYGGFLAIRGELSIGTLYAFYVYLDMLTGPMMDVPFVFMTGQQAFVSMDRIEEMRTYPVVETRPRGETLDLVHEIALDRVSFSYGGDREHLHDVSFTVAAGSRVAIVGPVASGKSTVLKLLAGIVNPHGGRILVNARPLTEWDWDSYRRLIGYVPQEALLFSQSIEENVIFGRTPQGDPAAWARECLSVAQMDTDLGTLPKGVETVVGQKGALVSGGQKQRIAIARALAGRPRVLLLDDCTAALDARNEDKFWARLDTELAGVTCFVVSHRLATIRRADSILVLDGGRLVDQGTHDQLVARSSAYREFLQTERKKEHLGVVGSAEAEVAPPLAE